MKILKRGISKYIGSCRCGTIIEAKSDELEKIKTQNLSSINGQIIHEYSFSLGLCPECEDKIRFYRIDTQKAKEILNELSNLQKSYK